MSTILKHSHEFSCVRLILLGEESDALSFSTRSTRSTDSVNVILDRQRERLIHYELDLGNIESTSSDVCEGGLLVLKSTRR